MTDGRPASILANRALKPNLSEGKDFMLVDAKVHQVFQEKYQLKEGFQPVPRNGIKCSDDEVIVELYLRKMQIVVIPNKQLFNFTAPMFMYVSRNDTMKMVDLKISRCLNNYLYSVIKNKEKTINPKKMRVWKSEDNNLDAIWELDKKFKNYSEVKVNAKLVNADDQKEIIFDDFNVMEEDIFVIELQKT